MSEVSWAEVAALVRAPPADPAGPEILRLAEALLDPALPSAVRPCGLLLLAAHLWTVLEPKIASESVGGVSVQYAQAALGEGLFASVWGMQYKVLVEQHCPTVPIVL